MTEWQTTQIQYSPNFLLQRGYNEMTCYTWHGLTSAGVPNIIIEDSKDTIKDMATGTIVILRLPTRYSDVVRCFPPDKA